MQTRLSFPGALLACALLALPASLPAKSERTSTAPAAAPSAPAKTATSVIRVNATSQPYDFLRPWSKRAPFQRRAVGAVLMGGRVLTTAEQVADVTFLELEKPDSGEKCQAAIETVDYECNLALLKPVNPSFLAAFKPLLLGDAAAGDELTICQLESNGSVLNTRALLTTVEVGNYPIGTPDFLVYRLSASLQPRDSGFTSPIVKGGTLTGMLLRFDSRSQTADAIPAPVIRHFLKAVEAKGGYTGFPQAGIRTAPLRDPQLRQYAGVPEKANGIYIRAIHPGAPAGEAGIQKGDVLTAVGGHTIDQDGNYADTRYGKISIQHLIACENFDGATVPFKILRQGKEMTLPVTLRHEAPSKAIIEPYTIDKAPRYYVLGGLVFQELSRQFLKEWGNEWIRKAPERFLYFDAYQDELFQNDPRSRIVILSNVLPSPCTVGYEELNCLVVTKINGVELKSLADIETALDKPVDGFHHITFMGHPGEIVIDAAQAAAIEKPLMRNYGLPEIKRL